MVIPWETDLSGQILALAQRYTSSFQENGFRLEYLLTTLVVAILLCVIARRRSDSSRSLLQYLFPKEVFWHESARAGYRYFLLDPLIRRIFFGPLFGLPVSVAACGWTQAALRSTVGVAPYELSAHEAYPLVFAALFTAVSLVVRDLGYYVQHRLMHGVPFLWEFHKVHHSAEVLTPITDARLHPFDLASIPIFTSGFLGVMQAFIDYGLTSQLSTLEIFGTNGILWIYYLFAYNLRHSHIWLSFGARLSRFIMSPAQHQIHHSCLERHLDKNFGSITSIWDWAFGTLYVPREREQLHLGLTDGESREYRSVWNMYTLPFRKNYEAGRAWAVVGAVAAIGILTLLSVPFERLIAWAR